MISIISNQQREINELKTQNEQQDEEIGNLKMEMSRLRPLSKRIIRSVANDSIKTTGESSWSKLEISPVELGSMPYSNYAINIYGHSSNNLASTTNDKKKFYYTPVARLDHSSATSSFNNVTQQPEMRFRVEMWNDAVQKEVVKFTSELIGYPLLKSDQVRVLPMEKVMLFSRIQSTTYQMVKDWKQTQTHRDLVFKIICYKIVDCDMLAKEMQTNPDQFDNFELKFSLSTQKSERREAFIQIENVLNGKLMSKLDQKFPDQDSALLTAADELKLKAETTTNIIVETFDDSEISSSESEQLIYRQLESLIDSSRVTIKEQSDKMWESVFWNDDNYRPDKTVRIFNEIFSKIDKEKRNVLGETFKNANKVAVSGGGSYLNLFSANVATNVDWNREGSLTKEDFEKHYQENKDNIQWDGEKFIPKPMALSRVNLAKLRNNQSYKDKKVRVSYTSSMLTVRLNIDPHYDADSTNQLFEIQSQIKGYWPTCFLNKIMKF